MEIDNKRILLLKEIPKKALTKWKKYKEIIEFLRNKNVRYRWELPEGVSFTYEGKRDTIRSNDQMEEFLEQHKTPEDKGKNRLKTKDGK